MPRPRTIHDFYGFRRPKLFAVQYSRGRGCPSSPPEISDAVHPTWVGADIDSWGIDHGNLVGPGARPSPTPTSRSCSWSINAEQGLRLPPRPRPQGWPACGAAAWLVVASGNVVHKPARDEAGTWPTPATTGRGGSTEDAKARMLDDPGRGHPALTRTVTLRTRCRPPTTSCPCLYLAGLASAGGEGADILVDGYTYGSLSMTAYTIGMECPPG